MKKIVDDVRTIYKCCSLYYEDSKSQQEICDYLGVSRATVSRMLKAGREQGIVTIEVKNPVKYSYGALEKELMRKFGLKEIIVVQSSVFDTRDNIATNLSEETYSYLSQLFRDGDFVGVSMGHTLYNVTNVPAREEADRMLTFVPLVGGISQSKMKHRDVQSNQIAHRFSALFGGRYVQFLSPAVFSNRDVREGFLKESSINYIFEYFQKLNVVIMGIGIPERERSTLVSAGYVEETYIESLMQRGVVGDIALHFYDKYGNVNPFHDFNGRVSSIPMDMLRRVPDRVAIVSEAIKAEAVRGAIAGGFVNILITDEACAEALLALT